MHVQLQGEQRCVSYMLQVVRELRCVFSWCLKASNVAGKLFQSTGVGKNEGTATEITSAGKNT